MEKDFMFKSLELFNCVQKDGIFVDVLNRNKYFQLKEGFNLKESYILEYYSLMKKTFKLLEYFHYINVSLKYISKDMIVQYSSHQQRELKFGIQFSESNLIIEIDEEKKRSDIKLISEIFQNLLF